MRFPRLPFVFSTGLSLAVLLAICAATAQSDDYCPVTKTPQIGDTWYYYCLPKPGCMPPTTKIGSTQSYSCGCSPSCTPITAKSAEKSKKMSRNHVRLETEFKGATEYFKLHDTPYPGENVDLYDRWANIRVSAENIGRQLVLVDENVLVNAHKAGGGVEDRYFRIWAIAIRVDGEDDADILRVGNEVDPSTPGIATTVTKRYYWYSSNSDTHHEINPFPKGGNENANSFWVISKLPMIETDSN